MTQDQPAQARYLRQSINLVKLTALETWKLKVEAKFDTARWVQDSGLRYLSPPQSRLSCLVQVGNNLEALQQSRASPNYNAPCHLRDV